MSYGSLSAKAIESLNKGAKIAGCYHNTGEGSLSPYHQFGADVILNIGTAYFGVRELDGTFSMEKLKQKVEDNPQLRAIELKLSQGAKTILVTDNPWFYIALVCMILGTQLFLAGFIGEFSDIGNLSASP